MDFPRRSAALRPAGVSGMGKLARELERRVRTPWGRNPPHCPKGQFSTNRDAPNLRVPGFGV